MTIRHLLTLTGPTLRAAPRRPSALLALAGLLAACASQPPAPQWQMTAQSALERYQTAYLDGNALVENAEFKRAGEQIARSGRTDLAARAALLRCATRVASLVFEDCAGFAAWRADATPADRAYAAYLAGRISAQDVELLPAPHRAAASASTDVAAAAAVQSIADPLTQLVAAGVLFRSGRATPALLATAADTASRQGWRRPLLAWLGAQEKQAELAGDRARAERLRRRIALASGGDAAPPR